MSESKLKQNLIDLINEKAHLLPYLLEEWEKKVAILENLDIMILAELEEEGEALKVFLESQGFKKVRFQVVELNKRNKIEAKLVIFHHNTSADSIKNLPNDKINRYTKEYMEEQKFLYYGPQNRELKSRMDRMTFANYPAKLKGNILGLFMS